MGQTNYFADSGGVSAILGSSISPSAMYFSGLYKRTYVLWQDEVNEFDIMITYYDHETELWADPIKIATNPIADTTDSHGAPALIVDNDGYIHVAFGSHSTSGSPYSISTNPEDISAWTAQTQGGSGNIGYNGAANEAVTYPRFLKINDGTLYIFFRGTNGDQHYQKTSAVGSGTATWGDSVEIINITVTDDMAYVGQPVYDSSRGRIHLAWHWYDATDEERHDLYHAYMDISTGKWYNMAGADLDTGISQTEMEVTYPTANYVKLVDTGTYEVGSRTPFIHLDPDGYPYIMWNEDIWDVEHGADDWKIHFIYWTGSAWTTKEALQAASVGGWTVPDFIVHSSTNIDAYVLNSFYQLEKWSWDGTTWTNESTINTGSNRCPVLVRDYTNIVRLIFIDANYIYALNSTDNYVTKTAFESMRDKVRVELQDSASEAVWTNSELDRAIGDALLEFSRKQGGQLVYDTMSFATTADSRLIDISSLSSVLLYGYTKESFHPTEGVEWKVSQWPRKFRNFKVFDTYIEMELDAAPGTADEGIYVKYYKVWTENQLPEIYKDIVVKLAAAKALIYKPLSYINTLMDETTTFSEISDGLTDMENRMTKSILDIEEARSYFNTASIGRPEQEYLNSAASELQAAISKMRKAQGDLGHFNARLAKIALGEKYETKGYRLLVQLQPELAKLRPYRAAYILRSKD